MAREFIGLGLGRLLLFCSIAMLSNCIRSVNVIRLKIPFQYIWHITPMCVHAPVFTCTHMHLCVHMCICRLDQTWVLFLRSHPFCFQKTGSFTDLELADWVRVTGQQGPGFSYLQPFPPTLGSQVHGTMPGFLTWALGISLQHSLMFGKNSIKWAISPTSAFLHLVCDARTQD